MNKLLAITLVELVAALAAYVTITLIGEDGKVQEAAVASLVGVTALVVAWLLVRERTKEVGNGPSGADGTDAVYPEMRGSEDRAMAARAHTGGHGGVFFIFGTALAALIVTIGLVASAKIDSEQTPESSSGSQSDEDQKDASGNERSNSLQECDEDSEIRRPLRDETVKGEDGLLVRGIVCNLGHRTPWLFERPTDGKYYYLDYVGAPAPLQPDKAGEWEFDNFPMGSEGDVDEEYTLYLVLASHRCEDILLSAKKDDHGDYKFKDLPPGCISTHAVTVSVTY